MKIQLANVIPSD